MRPLLTTAGPAPASPATTEAYAVCRDASRPLVERLEALEDLRDAEVGDTPLIRARGLERRYGLRQLYLKFDGDNPTGTQKDRIAFAQVADALRRGFDAVCFATCGNYGVAMAHAAAIPGLRCIAVVPTGYDAPRIAQMQALGCEVQRLGEDYEASVVAASQLAAQLDCYDANPGGDNEFLQLAAYREIAFEIYDELRDAPRAVAVPVSNGTTLAGVYKGFVSLQRRGRAARLAQVVAGSAYRKNPIVRSFKRGLTTCADLDGAQVRETAVNEPLVNWHAIDGQLALDALRRTDGWADDVSDRRMRALASELRREQGLLVQPAATAGLAALLAWHAQSPLPPDRYVAVLTGRT